MLPSTSSSGIVSPSSERRHIHFNEQVEQCIAVDIKGDDDDDSILAINYDYDSDSDDGAIMMKRTVSKPRMQRRQSNLVQSNESKTIAMLPSTTLKHFCEDTPDILGNGSTGSAMKHSYRSPVLSPSSSQETLRPSKMSGKFFHEEDDEVEDDYEDRTDKVFGQDQYIVQQPEDDDDDDNNDDDDDSDSDSDNDHFGMSMGGAKRRTGGLLSSASTSRLGGHSIDSALHASSTFANNGGSGGGLKRTTSTNSIAAEPAGMRRTASGMFMPYDEGEPAGGEYGGLLGRVIDTVNTARDIVHVIWNVGWNS